MSTTLRDRITAAVHSATRSWDEPQIVAAVIRSGIAPTGVQWDDLAERLASEFEDPRAADDAYWIVRAWWAEVAR